MTRPIRVLFVCTANTCRSPFMEIYARRTLGPGVHFSSAGTHALDHEPMSAEMLAELEARGLDADGFRSRPVTPELVDESDLVLTAEQTHRRFVLDASPDADRRVLTLGQASRASASIGRSTYGRDAIPDLATVGCVVEPTDGVADPFGRGPAAAAAAAGHMAGMLDQFLPVLMHHTSAEGKPAHG